MLRAIILAVIGQIYFIVSLPMMMPLRIKPFENYNLFLMPFLAVLFFFLFYRACSIGIQNKAYTYGFFSGIVLWQLIGEVASIPVPAGYIKQYANLDLKVLGGYFYTIVGWLMLYILWRTKSIKNPVAVCFTTFLGIWTFEIYMHNYSGKIPVELMPKVANVIMAVFLVLSIIILVAAKRAATVEKKTVMGVFLYLTIAVILMAGGQWRKPMTFYMTHEAEHMEHQIQEMKKEIEYIEKLKTQLGIEAEPQNHDSIKHEDVRSH